MEIHVRYYDSIGGERRKISSFVLLENSTFHTFTEILIFINPRKKIYKLKKISLKLFYYVAMVFDQ